MTFQPLTAGEKRLADARHFEDGTGDATMHWRLWGSYLSDRQLATVREDYTRCGSFWYYLHTITRGRAPTAGSGRPAFAT